MTFSFLIAMAGEEWEALISSSRYEASSLSKIGLQINHMVGRHIKAGRGNERISEAHQGS